MSYICFMCGQERPDDEIPSRNITTLEPPAKIGQCCGDKKKDGEATLFVSANNQFSKTLTEAHKRDIKARRVNPDGSVDRGAKVHIL